MEQCKEMQQVRNINGDERDSYMGHVPGVTAYQMDEDGVITEVSDRYRHELLGKGIHEQHVWAYFYHRNNQPMRLARSMMSQVSTGTPDQLELFLSSFATSDDRCEWFRNNTMAAYKMI